MQPGGSRHANGVYQIIFQVWRPSPTVDQNGCYTDVGHNTFTGMLQEGGKVELTVEPSSYITAYPGDVVGLFVISEIGGGIQLESNQAMNTVWYHTTSESNILIQVSNMCKFPVGTAGTLQNFTAAAPILQVSTCKFMCYKGYNSDLLIHLLSICSWYVPNGNNTNIFSKPPFIYS